MGVYSTTRCGICKTTWEFMEFGTTSPNGPPHVKWNSSRVINYTKKKMVFKFLKKTKK